MGLGDDLEDGIVEVSLGGDSIKAERLLGWDSGRVYRIAGGWAYAMGWAELDRDHEMEAGWIGGKDWDCFVSCAVEMSGLSGCFGCSVAETVRDLSAGVVGLACYSFLSSLMVGIYVLEEVSFRSRPFGRFSSWEVGGHGRRQGLVQYIRVRKDRYIFLLPFAG
jgi:hypothetical protein